ncbi:hypothetical protein NPIL_325881 [Nephila pilipes]|uniref:Uncharacterized protein n=1 Tax=Nephila pilipes TaxID=299642 RepID=A0A8X6NIZ1_NEPPI|nr:hypothetical protein NPIL_325881 [Nephila pilipes]
MNRTKYIEKVPTDYLYKVLVHEGMQTLNKNDLFSVVGPTFNTEDLISYFSEDDIPDIKKLYFTPNCKFMKDYSPSTPETIILSSRSPSPDINRNFSINPDGYLIRNRSLSHAFMSRSRSSSPTNMRSRSSSPTHMRSRSSSPTHIRSRSSSPTHMRSRSSSPSIIHRSRGSSIIHRFL